jgi:hypothetical protein
MFADFDHIVLQRYFYDDVMFSVATIFPKIHLLKLGINFIGLICIQMSLTTMIILLQPVSPVTRKN